MPVPDIVQAQEMHTAVAAGNHEHRPLRPFERGEGNDARERRIHRIQLASAWGHKRDEFA